jgi:regulator of PEP synthase PpsR (kinase-PPPase family)
MPDSFAAAREERLKVSGNPSQYDNLQIFIEEQELISELVEKSLLPAVRIDISDNNIKKAADTVADWMENTGGLWMDS